MGHNTDHIDTNPGNEDSKLNAYNLLKLKEDNKEANNEEHHPLAVAITVLTKKVRCRICLIDEDRGKIK